MRFVMLVPKSLDPAARGRKMPLPDPRPSETIAKLFPQADPSKDQQKDQKNGVKPPEASMAPGAKDTAKATEAAKKTLPAAAQPPAAVGQASSAQTAAANPVPLPEARPNIKSSGEARRPRYVRRYRRVR
jgi:membrane-bound lytic murein transglycosylase A